jgi:conjugal transfer pilus assembly protein TrbC
VWATDRFLQSARAIAFCLLSPATTANASPRAGLPPDPPAPHAPRIEALPQPATRDAIDLDALARGFAGDGRIVLPASGHETQLLIFITLAMPEAALKRLVTQATRVRARLVLRGLSEGSLVRTAARIQGLVGQQQAAVQIDPRGFDRYAVRQVPTFVLARGANAGGCTAGQCSGMHAAVAGDVSLDYALRQIRDRAPAFRDDATRLLERLDRQDK